MNFKKIMVPAVLLLFLICWLIARYSGIELFLALPGLLLIYYIPGNLINNLIIRFKLHWFGKLALDISSSIVLVYLTHLFFKRFVAYNGGPLIIMIVVLNVILWLANYFLKPRTEEYELKEFDSKLIIWSLAIPLAAFVLRLILNQYIYEIDSGLYFDIYQKLIQTGQDHSFLSGLRNGFSLYMALTNYVAGIGFIGFFKFITPCLFYLSSLALLEICVGIKNRLTSLSSYLLFLAAPIIPIMNEGVRPETYVLILTFPIFYLIYNALKSENLVMLLIAMLYSAVSFRFHEFGAFLVLASLLAAIIFVVQKRKYIFNAASHNWWITLLFVLPYLIILKQNISVFTAQISTGIFQTTMQLVKNSILHFHWDWWFIDNYTAIDGGKIGWPGFSFIFYYLYNGISVLALLIIVLIIIRLRRKKKTGITNEKPWPYVPIVIFLLIYFAFAEILPRLGVFILPNRAWPHIIMASAFMVVIGIIYLQEHNFNLRFINILLILCVVSGILGAIVGSTYMGSVVTPSERVLIDELNKLPKDSIITSSQPNKNLVEMYGNRKYVEVGPVDLTDPTTFSKTVNTAMLEVLEQQNDKLFSSIVFEKSITELQILNGNIVKKAVSSIPVGGGENLMSTLKQYDPIEYAYLDSQIAKNKEAASKPTYFLYSFEKFNGIMSKRQWWLKNNDFDNLERYKEIAFPEIIYKGDDGIIIKIK